VCTSYNTLTNIGEIAFHHLTELNWMTRRSKIGFPSFYTRSLFDCSMNSPSEGAADWAAVQTYGEQEYFRV
jgi:hypothetical protein